MSNKTSRPEKPVRAGGRTDWAALDAMSESDIDASMRAAADCPPPSPDQAFHRMARAKRIRLGLVLSQEQFAKRYRIPLPTLVAWERHEAEPDPVALAFLDAIAADPDGIANSLAQSSKKEQVAV